ncbi:MAG: molybdopterin-dependent oxidoreductase [Acidobacteriota bacterium]|nr:molybdopterin-dependent oxidoreductase [Acidobacteriota bacterium]
MPDSPKLRTAREEMAARTRRGFMALGAGAVAGVAGWEWLRNGPDADGLSSRFRRGLEFNERVTSRALFSDNHLAPVFANSRAGEPRPNGDEGLNDEIENRDWRLEMTPYGSAQPSRKLNIDEIRKMPKTEHVTEFKCIEGWSKVVHWAGVRFSDFTAAVAPGSERARFVGLQTPDEEYYAGIDMPSAMHPQTLLCYEMNGQDLTDEHGAPLRLIIPVKYGIKNLKRIGSIAFTDERPADYWAERGYDYYAGL